MRSLLRSFGVVAAVALGVALVAALITLVFAPRPVGSGWPEPGAPPEPLPRWAPPVAPPVAAATPTGPGVAGLVDLEWLGAASDATGIPARALAAYAGAAIVKAAAMPECRLSWATLAGIGAIESDHARHGGSRLDETGTAVPPIFGVALDGDGVALIPDSDGGEIDGDPDGDRAVGPMQLIPQTWRNWHVDGNGDGIEDPQNIDDAVVAASNYLCRASTAFDTEEGWRTGVISYNSATDYVGRVARAAIRYGDAVA
ncbi:lytic murein transglycosylase [Protaetiibacter larvae]|nr:lytic murein transglycosylase [Protaetiibacter larvae]